MKHPLDFTLTHENRLIYGSRKTLQTADMGVTTAFRLKALSSTMSEEFALSRSRKIVFFFPSFASSDATAPLGILAVATPLLAPGIDRLIDSTITPNYKKRVLEEVRDALCLGISLVTGPMIRETVEIAQAVKEWNPIFQ